MVILIQFITMSNCIFWDSPEAVASLQCRPSKTWFANSKRNEDPFRTTVSEGASRQLPKSISVAYGAAAAPLLVRRVQDDQNLRDVRVLE